MDKRVALVTGGAKRVGRAIVERLAADHDCVVHSRRDIAGAESVAAAINDANGRAIVVQADLGSADERALLVARIEEVFGRLDTFVASAAATKFGPILGCESRHVERTFATVVTSFVELAQATATMMGVDGRIVAISGLDARFAQSGHGLLGAAKAAVESIMRSLSSMT